MSAASTRAPFCNNTSAAAIDPRTAAQCNAVCPALSVAWTFAPCYTRDQVENIIIYLQMNNQKLDPN